MHPNEVHIRLGSITLNGSLAVPNEARGIVVFAHGSGSTRHSPRNQMVASYLQKKGLATLLFDLLTVEEDQFYENRFNIDLLTERLIGVTKWLHHQEGVNELPIALFGASTGAAAALKAAAQLPNVVAVVSRGGRPDLAKESLHNVQCPTLLIVGSKDFDVLRLNEYASMQLKCNHKLELVPGATHLFEEPGAMEMVCRLAAQWFLNFCLAGIAV